MSAFDESVFWPEFKRAGMLQEATTVQAGCSRPTPFDVLFARPDFNPMTGVRSRDPEIEYQHHDVPGLAEGNEVIVGGILYRVRETPIVDPTRGASGFFRTAKLTQVDPEHDV